MVWVPLGSPGAFWGLVRHICGTDRGGMIWVLVPHARLLSALRPGRRLPASGGAGPGSRRTGIGLGDRMVSSLSARITLDPAVMGGRPCIRGMRVTVGTVVGLLGAGRSMDEVLAAYPYLEREDLLAALTYAAWRAQEVELPLSAK